MERNVNSGPVAGMRPSDLRDLHVITAACGRCGHRARVPADFLAWERPGATRLVDLAAKLRCMQCGNRVGNTIAVGQLPRN